MDPAHLETLLDDSVRAVVLVHYAGIACDVDGIRKVLKDRPDVAVIEDNAHGLFGRWREQPLGSLGRFATQSFHDTKNFFSGEGGALVISEARDVDRARVLYDKGTNRRAFMMGQVDKYSWKDTGSSFGLSDILAAQLWGQLERREVIQHKRRVVFDRYAGMLADVADGLGVTLPLVPADCESAYHMYHVLLPDRATRDKVLVGMREQGVQATFHYVPLHSSDAGRRFAARQIECPVTDDISGRLLRLPFYNNLTEAEAEQVVNAFTNAVAGAPATRS
jgi:dTDP-4-amino-4,6-dideoxygalactose transaminase